MNIILGGTHGLGADIASELRAHGEETFIVGSSYDESKHGAGMLVDLLNMDEVGRLESRMRGLGANALTGFYWVAGYGYKTDFADQGDVLAMVDVNLRNPLSLAQAAWQKIVRQSVASNFVVVSSTTGVKVRADETIYATTKAAQVMFARGLGSESERLKTPVKVALFEPGGMKSPFWDRNRPENYDDFMETADVAHRIVGRVLAQTDPFYEEMIQRQDLHAE